MSPTETANVMALLNAIDDYRATLQPRRIKLAELEAEMERHAIVADAAENGLAERVRILRHLMATPPAHTGDMP